MYDQHSTQAATKNYGQTWVQMGLGIADKKELGIWDTIRDHQGWEYLGMIISLHCSHWIIIIIRRPQPIKISQNPITIPSRPNWFVAGDRGTLFILGVFLHGLTDCRRKMFESEVVSSSKPDTRVTAAQESREGWSVLFLLLLMISTCT